MHLRRLFFLYFSLLLFDVNAQFQTGVLSSNYSGVMGVHINPAGTSWLSDGADFVPVAGSFEATNNHYKLQAQPLYELMNGSFFKVVSDTNNDNIITHLVENYYLRKDLQPNGFANINAALYGPSLLINYRKRSFGFITSFKTYSSASNIPPDLANFLFNGAKVTPATINIPYKLNGFTAVAGSFVDLGYTNSNLVYDHAEDQLRFGFNARLLIGLNAYYIRDLSNTELTLGADSVLQIKNGGVNYGFAAHSTYKGEKFLTPRAYGAAFDLGFLYVRKDHPSPTRVKKKCPNIYGWYRDYQTYKWRLGVSVTDIGSLFFVTQSYNRTYENINYGWKNFDSLVYSGVFSFDNRVRNNFGSNPNINAQSSESFYMIMPTRLNVQFDVHVKNHWYANLLLAQRLTITPLRSFISTNVLSTSLRYERQFFEFAVPVSLIDYTYPTGGVYLRLGFVYFGTNTLPELIGLRDIKNVDLYAGIKINLGFLGRRGMGF